MSDPFLGAELGADVPEIDLHGMGVREAVDATERLLQGAFMHKERIVRIVHGRGDGTLRDVVRAHLEAHPNVRGFRTDDGATYAELER